MKITKIEAAKPAVKNLRVAAYCRISTMFDNQLSSIDNQYMHYKKMITGHTGWELAGIYVEEGVTGTKRDIRPELNRMLDDCKAGKIDLILTKSISRFARNTADCLEMVHIQSTLKTIHHGRLPEFTRMKVSPEPVRKSANGLTP